MSLIKTVRTCLLAIATSMVAQSTSFRSLDGLRDYHINRPIFDIDRRRPICPHYCEYDRLPGHRIDRLPRPDDRHRTWNRDQWYRDQMPTLRDDRILRSRLDDRRGGSPREHRRRFRVRRNLLGRRYPEFDLRDRERRCDRLCSGITPRCYSCLNGGEMLGRSCHCSIGFQGECCEFAVSCGSPGTIANGQVSPTGSSHGVGTIVTFTCNAGYNLVGDAPKRVCQQDGSWTGSGPPTCQQITCGHPGTLSHGHVSPPGDSHVQGTRVTFACDSGYRLEGSATRTCQGLGRWTGSVPTCHIVTCPDLPTLSHGHTQQDGQNYGATARFSCEADYDIAGDATRTCQANGHWSGTQPTCTIASCSALTAPANGVISGSNLAIGSHVAVHCVAGYYVSGPPVISCQSGRVWSHPPPACTLCPANHYKAGTNADTSCHGCPPHSHTVTGLATTHLHCTCDEGWRGPNGGPCQAITCPRPSTPVNGLIEQCSTEFGGHCEFGCRPGYVRASGDDVFTCDALGWVGTPLVCSACDPDTYTTDGRTCSLCPDRSHTSGPGTGPDSCVCEAGFTKDDQNNCVDLDECTANSGGCEQACENTIGSFICRCTALGFMPDADDVTRCVPENECDPLPAPEHGGYVCVQQVLTNTRRCQIKCDRGYEHVVAPNIFEECGPTTDWGWSYSLQNEEILDCREELFPGFVLDSAVSFFVAECSSLTPTQIEEAKAGFLAYLHQQNLCTSTGPTACRIEDVTVHCHGQTGSGRRRRRRSGGQEELEFRFRMKLDGVARLSTDCEQSCTTETECESCVNDYRRNAQEVLVQEVNRVREIFGQAPSEPEVHADPIVIAESHKYSYSAMNAHRGDGDVAYAETDMPIVARPSPGLFQFGGLAVQFHDMGAARTSLECDDGTIIKNGMCVACAPGTISSGNNSTVCSPCPAQTYQPDSRQSNCLPCADQQLRGQATCGMFLRLY